MQKKNLRKQGGVNISGGHVALAPTKTKKDNGKTELRKIPGVACASLFLPEELSKRFTDVVPRGYRFQAICILMTDLIDRVESGEMISLDAEKVKRWLPTDKK